MFQILIDYKEKVLKERDKCLDELDIKYIHYINEILQQKVMVRKSIQRICKQQINIIDNLLRNQNNNNNGYTHTNLNINTNQISQSNNNSKQKKCNTKQKNCNTKPKSDFHCLYCSSSFTNYQSLRNHTVTHQNKSTICKHCPFASRSLSKVQEHNTQHMHKKDRKYACDLCLKQFNSHTSFSHPWTLTDHKWRIHKVKTKTNKINKYHKSKLKSKSNKVKKVNKPIENITNIPPNSNSTISNHINPFISHMSLEEALNLHINDKMDHRDTVGCFTEALIVDKKENNLKVHYTGWDTSWDTWVNIKTELYQIAKYQSISSRLKHRFFEISKGDFMDINPIKHRGWKIGKVCDFDKGQVKIVYHLNDYFHYWWVHMDNQDEIAKLQTKQPLKQPLFDYECNNNMNKKHNNYHCIYCEYSFADYTHLKKHLNVHNDRPYICSKCPNAFKSNSHLENHISQHKCHGTNIYKCDLCLKLFQCLTAFAAKAALTRHQKRVHKLDKNNVVNIYSGNKRKTYDSNSISTNQILRKKIKTSNENISNNKKKVLNCKIWQLWEINEKRIKNESDCNLGIGLNMRLKNELRQFILKNKLCKECDISWNTYNYESLKQKVLFDLCLRKMSNQ